jgi:hypothetical protein
VGGAVAQQDDGGLRPPLAPEQGGGGPHGDRIVGGPVRERRPAQAVSGLLPGEPVQPLGGSLEAGAGRDTLNLSVRVLRKDLGLGLDLLAEAILSPAFPPAEVARKIPEIQAAIKRSEEDPGSVAGRALGLT